MISHAGLGSEIGSSGAFESDASQALAEQANFYAGGYKAGENELADYRKAFFSKAPDLSHPGTLKAAQAAREAAHNMMDKIRAQYDTYDSELPRAVPRVGFIDPNGANAYKQITGETVDPKLIRRPQGAAMTAVSKADGKLHWTDKNQSRDLGIVPGQ